MSCHGATELEDIKEEEEDNPQPDFPELPELRINVVQAAESHEARLSRMTGMDELLTFRCLKAAKESLSQGIKLRNYICFSCGNSQLDEGRVARAPPTATR